LRLLRPGHLELQEVLEPIVRERDVLIRVRVAGICGTDVHIYREGFPGVYPPLTLGHEFAGEVAAMGRRVGGFQLGERVTAENVVSCGHCPLCRSGRHEICLKAVGPGFDYDGAMAEYIAVPAHTVHRVPVSLNWQEAGAIEPSANSLWAVERGRVGPGDRVAVIGDGFLGLVMARMAKVKGAAGVALVGLNEFRLARAREMGADLAINAANTDAAAELDRWTGGAGCSVTIDAAGGASALRQALEVVSPGGRVVMFGLPDPSATVDLSRVVLAELELIGSLGHPNRWEDTIRLMGDRHLEVQSLLTHLLPLEEGIRAFELAGTGADESIKVQLSVG
jgi:2-desacetyl-2-hydroxyethyl bacteriochlorophyllide A dehydrogenase